MPKLLTDLEIEEVSAVDDPAAEDARMVIVKAKGGFKPCDDCKSPGDCMKKGACKADGEKVPLAKLAGAIIGAIDELSPEIVEKALAEGFSAYPGAADMAATFIKETVMDFDTVTKALEQANESIEAKDSEIADLKKQLAAAEKVNKAANGNDDEDVLKGLPEAIRKRLEDAERTAREATEAVAKAAEEREVEQEITKARALKIGKAEELGPALLRIRKGNSTAADAALIETLLRSAGEVQATANIFKNFGAPKAVEGDPEEILKAKAVAIQKDNKGMTFEQAYSKALEENPEVYDAYIAKRR